MLQRTKYIKSEEYQKYKSNFNSSFPSYKYHHKKNQNLEKNHLILGKGKILPKIGTKKMTKIT